MNCKWMEVILALLVIVFTFWSNWAYASWVVGISAILIVLHAFMCQSCHVGRHGMSMPGRKK